MDSGKTSKPMEPVPSPEVINQRMLINQLATAVQDQNARLVQLTQDVKSALSSAHDERQTLKDSTASTASALVVIVEKLDSLSSTITPNSVLSPPPEPEPPSHFEQNSAFPPHASQYEPLFSNPAVFDGDLSHCRGFVEQCEMMFRHQSYRYMSAESKVAKIVSLLSGRALEWAVASLKKTPSYYSDYSAFLSEFRLVFDHPAVTADSESRLLRISQASRSVAEYAVEFRILAAGCDWNDNALMSAFRAGLNETVRDKIFREKTPSLASLITSALEVDDYLRSKRPERSKPAPIPSKALEKIRPSAFNKPVLALPTAETSEPMQIGRSRLTTGERSHRMSAGLCLYCGESGHFIRECKTRPKGGILVSRLSKPQASEKSSEVNSETNSESNRFPVVISCSNQSLTVGAMIDSGADDNFIDYDFAKQTGLKISPLPRAFNVHGLNGNFLGKITHEIEPVSLTLSGNHTETIHFKILHSSAAPVVLGRPWLAKHDPSISWTSNKITSWGKDCFKNCLRSAPLPSKNSEISAVPPDVSCVPDVYRDLSAVFSKDSACSLPPHRPYDCGIDLLPGAPLPKSRLYNLSLPEKATMEKYIRESLENGIIRPSSSPVAAGFFFVSKKDGSLRPCIDYRHLNDITVKNRYPLPLISSTFEPLAGAKVFTKLDLRNAYHLVRIREGDEWKTAFNTHLGHFEYLVMPFGLTNAPAVFQNLVNDLLRDMINKFVVVFLDDILVFSPSEDEHVNHVRAVLQRLLENRLFVKAEKCEFHATSVEFLGHVIKSGAVEADPKKVTAVTEWDVPTDRTQLRRFLGFANFYRKFIKNFSEVAAPLNALTSPAVPFQWSTAADAAFQRLKTLFSTAPVLSMPDPSRQFILEVDASETGIGAVLSQRDSTDGQLHPCAFYSRRLTPAERNYDVGNRELLAVHDALKEWRHWLEGSAQPFLVLTDHKNLTYLRTAKRLSPRQSRWALFFTRFHFSIMFKPGSENVRADALSRQFSDLPEPEEPETILPETCFVGAVTWDLEDEVVRALGSTPAPDGCPPHCLFVPSELRAKVLDWGHTHKLSGHPGAARTEEFLRRRFWWPGLSADTRAFVAACDVCARGKNSHRPPAGLLHPLEIPSRPWSHIAMDFVTGLPLSNGHSVILTIVDRFSKAVHYVPLAKLPSSSELAELLALHVVRLHGIPVDIVTDRGPQFASKTWQAFCRGIGAKVSLTSGYHPQSNGQAERANQSLEETLRCYCQKNPANWSSCLPWVEYAHNTLVSSSSGLSPFESSLGYQPPLFPAQEEEFQGSSPQDHVARCQRVWEKTRQALLASRDRAVKTANRRRTPAPEYAPGQEVYLRAKDLPIPGTNPKLAPRYVGPFPIASVINPVSVKLTLPPSMKINPVFHVSQLKPVTVSPHSNAPPAPPAPLTLPDGGLAWEVDKIIDVRRYGRGYQYLVDWKGYSPEFRSWIPRSFFPDAALLSAFYAAHPHALGRPPGVGRKGGGTVVPPAQQATPPTCPRRTRRT